MKLENDEGSYVSIADTGTGRTWFITHQNDSGLKIARDDIAGDRLLLEGDGSFQVGGDWFHSATIGQHWSF